MLDPAVATCKTSKTVAFPDGKILEAIPYNIQSEHRCHDCNIMPGGFHHPGCDMERCPRCDEQLISCGCLSRKETENGG